MVWVIVLLALLGAPIFSVFGGLSLHAYRTSGLDASLIVGELSRLATMPLLQALPMFALAGYILAGSGAAQRLLRVSRAAFGWLPGGLSVVALLACTLLTSFTGASGVTIVALGGLLLPALLAEKYGDRYSLGLITNAGNLGVLFVPSLPLILYAVIANQVSSEVTIDRLFKAAALPGILGLGFLSVYGVSYAVSHRVPRVPFSVKELLRALWAARWEVPLPFVVLGGIYAGKLVVSEAAVMTAAYSLVVEVFIQREIRFRALAKIVRDCTVLVGGVLIILGMGMAMTNYLVDQEVPTKIFDVVQAHISSRLAFLLALNFFLLIVGCLMDIYTAIIVVVPLIIPIALRFGVNPVHMGVIFLANLAIGYVTPPVGMNLFIASIRFDKSVIELSKASIPFILVLLAALAIITYVPALSLWLGG
ncbi:MAG: TRAP transporter large permease subunit [Verrucomicrobiota bacterium]